MVSYRKCKPMSIKRINLLLESHKSDYRLKKENGEIIMVKKNEV